MTIIKNSYNQTAIIQEAVDGGTPAPEHSLSGDEMRSEAGKPKRRNSDQYRRRTSWSEAEKKA